MTTPTHPIHPQNRPQADAPPDFRNALFIAERPGGEFASLRHARLWAPAAGGMLFMPVIGFAAILHLALVHLGAPPAISAMICTALAFVALLQLLPRVGQLSGAGGGGGPWQPFHLQSNTDTRYRVRAVIPRHRRTPRLGRWAMLATGAEPETMPEDPAELDAVRGGFEPIIVRPWLGAPRSRAYRNVSILAGCAVAGAIVVWVITTGSAIAQFGTLRMWGWMGLIVLGAVGTAEFCFPAYLRLSPGRLDLFEYPFLGAGKPRVTTHDLRTAGICVDFGSATLAIEPPRPPGEPAAPLRLGRKWPHFQEHAPEAMPTYYSVALCPGRTAFCQRLIQAARTEEPTPPLEDEL